MPAGAWVLFALPESELKCHYKNVRLCFRVI